MAQLSFVAIGIGYFNSRASPWQSTEWALSHLLYGSGGSDAVTGRIEEVIGKGNRHGADPHSGAGLVCSLRDRSEHEYRGSGGYLPTRGLSSGAAAISLVRAFNTGIPR